MLEARLKLQNPGKIERDITKVLVTTINKGVFASLKNIKSATQNLTLKLLKHSDFAQALLHGRLSGDLGLPKNEVNPRFDKVINTLVAGIQVTYTPMKAAGTNITSGNLLIGIGKDDFKEIIDLFAASIITDKLDILNWVEWTLLKGDQVVILGYDIKYGNFGRSGLAVMIEKASSVWRVPPPFDGTANDNWINRTVRDHISQYETLLENIISVEIQKAAL